MTNRRSIFGYLAAALGTLLAGCRGHNRQKDEDALRLTPERREAARRHREDIDALLARARAAEFDWIIADEEAAELRGLLASASETIRHDPFHDSEHLIARIEAAIDRSQT